MKEKGEQIFDQINKASNILITGHASWNEETLTNALALKIFLEKIDKKSDIVIEDGGYADFLKPSWENFSIFPKFSEIKNSVSNLYDFIVSINIADTEIEKIKYKVNGDNLDFYINLAQGNLSEEDISAQPSNFKYDLIIVLNTPDPELLGQIYQQNPQFFYNTPVINIDNQPSNEEYGQINCVEITCSSVAEILYSLFKECSGDKIDQEIATCLLGSIIYKTKNFKTFVTPQTLSLTSQLIDLGGDKDKIIDTFYRSRNLNALKLWGKALNNLSSLKGLDNKLIWTVLKSEDFQETATTEKELIDLIDEIVINIPKVNVVVVFYEQENDQGEQMTNFIVYSHKNISLKNLFKNYGAQGNEKVIQAQTREPIDNIKKEVVTTLLEPIKKLEE